MSLGTRGSASIAIERTGKHPLRREAFDMKRRRFLLVLLAITATASLERFAYAQSLTDTTEAPREAPATSSIPTSLVPSYPRWAVTYTRPPEKTKLQNYFFEAYGPYPIVVSAFGAGISQLENAPPEWKHGAEGYGRRFGSDFGIAAVSTTTRYALAEAFREDTLYYRCACKGFFPRLTHAVLSTFISRRGEDGHRVFSFPALVAPYAGAMTAVYGWYPSRFDSRDGFRIGNYALLGYVGANVGLEFIYSGNRSLLSRMHLTNAHAAPVPGLSP